jgi:aspartate aminotransferase-like enzyme
MIGHRGSDIQMLMGRIADGLAEVFVSERPVFVSTSSATGVMEAAVRNGVAGGKVLSLVNGAFSARFAEISKTCGLDTDVWEVEYGQVHSAGDLSARLAESAYDAVTLSQSETSTGALQDLEALAMVVSEHERTLLLVDSVTGVGGVETHPDEWGIDFLLTGSQKAMALPPGLAFAVASEAMMERSADAPAKGWYFDLIRLAKQLATDQTPATPAISLLYSLDTQLDRIRAEGMPARWQRHLDMQGRTLEWIDSMKDSGVGIDAFAAEGHRSPTVTCVALAEGTSASEVVAAVKGRGWVIGGGYGKLSETTIRIGHMGDHTLDELNGLLVVLEEVLA